MYTPGRTVLFVLGPGNYLQNVPIKHSALVLVCFSTSVADEQSLGPETQISSRSKTLCIKECQTIEWSVGKFLVNSLN